MSHKMVPRSFTLAQRLEYYSAPQPDGCRVWTGSTHPAGYGQLSWEGRSRKAHRLAWEVANGPVTDGRLHVCHKCDTPACINPDHLFLGTHEDNHADKVAKGRQQRGVRHWRAVFAEEQIRAIREDTRPQVQIAAQYGVRPNAISRIRNGVRWGHIA